MEREAVGLRRCEERDCCEHKSLVWAFSPAQKRKRTQALSEQIKTFRELADELHEPLTRRFTRRRVIAKHVDQIWAAGIVEMQKILKVEQRDQTPPDDNSRR